MVHCGAILKGRRERLLQFHPAEAPVALQLGGNCPAELAECAEIAAQHGYSEVNLNIGCPSDRVQSGQFGACLMASPVLVADCVAAMRDAAPVPVTVKNRIGIGKDVDYDFLSGFVSQVAAAGCRTFIVHARNAWLEGLSPRENREVPPLDYPRVYRLKRDFPHLEIIINGGIRDYSQVDHHLDVVDGVMIGRRAYEDPYYWREIDQRYFGIRRRDISRETFVKQYCDYIQSRLDENVRLKHMARHLLNMFYGQPGARSWRRFLSDNMRRSCAGVEVIEHALGSIEPIQCA